MFCQKCGKENSDSSMYCSGCGASLNGNVEAVKAEPKLDLHSFLAVSKEYENRKKKTVSPFIAAMVVSMLIGAVAFMVGFIMFSGPLMAIGGIFMGISMLVIMPIMAVKASKLDKYGNKLYAEYLENK